MDSELIKKLETAGLPLDPDALALGIPREGEKLVRSSGPFLVMDDENHSLLIDAKPLSALFMGNRQPPMMREEPPEEYLPFFYTIEHAAALACVARGRPETDREFERLYRLLRRRPDGRDENPVFECLQRAAQVYLSLRDVSSAEYEAVMDRLGRSAKTFHTHVGSTNYFTSALEPLLEEP